MLWRKIKKPSIEKSVMTMMILLSLWLTVSMTTLSYVAFGFSSTNYAIHSKVVQQQVTPSWSTEGSTLNAQLFERRRNVGWMNVRRRDVILSESSSSTSMDDASNTLSSSFNYDNNNTDAVAFTFDSTVSTYTEQKQEWEQLQQQILQLEHEIIHNSTNTSTKQRLQQLERIAIQNGLKTTIPPSGLSIQEFMAAIAGFMSFPFTIRYALCDAVLSSTTKVNQYYNDDEDVVLKLASNVTCIPYVLSDLYERPPSPIVLQSAMTRAKKKSRSIVIKNDSSPQSSSKRDVDNSTVKKKKRTDPNNRMRTLFSSSNTNELDVDEDVLTEDEERIEGIVQTLLPRVTRAENRVPNQSDLDIVLKAIPNDVYTVSDVEVISGGYILRGTPRNSDTIVQQLTNTKIPNDLTICYLPDFTNPDPVTSQPMLALFRTDMTPTGITAVPSILLSVSAIFSCFLFSVGCYTDNNNSIMNTKLQEEISVLGSAGTAQWFTDKVFEICIPILCIGLIHELGHWIMATILKQRVNQNNATDEQQVVAIQPSSVQLYPFFVQLPWLGGQTKLATSPASKTVLYDFAIAGPVAGIVASFVALGIGLEQTVTATSEALQYYPSVPIEFLKSSTLGAYIIDTVLGDGTGMLLAQANVELSTTAAAVASSGIALSPLAIAGYTGILIQALELLPLGATDGGRISLSLFGRNGHAALGGLVWFGLLLATIFGTGEDATTSYSLLVSTWLVYTIVQNDPELPCRDEVTNVDAIRSIGAFLLWFLTALIIIPT